MRRLAAIGLLMLAAACQRGEKTATAQATAGNADAGKAALDKYGCAACHIIPGVQSPRGMAGPSLEHLKSRALLAGKLPNNPESLSNWMQNPQAYNPQGSMPNLGVTPDDARNISAYLYAQP